MHGVLIVDDEALVREAIVNLGEWSNFEIDVILEAADASCALAMLRTHPEVDIVLTDMKMPELDGPAFLREMTRLGMAKATIAISGHSDYKYTRQAIKSGLIDYILKPIASEDLNSALAEAVKFLEQKPGSAESFSIGVAVDEAEHRGVIDVIITYIDAHYLENLSLQELADQFAMSREHLSRHFKRATGTNLFEYIVGKKIEAAKILLATTDLPVKSIAYELGYRDEHYFSKASRKAMNMRPTEYRKM
jgi:YesN/AraC family two-component response regulator